MERGRFVIHQDALTAALKSKGYRSISDLAIHLGIHRNTIGRYLSGEPALPEAVEKIILALDLSPEDLIQRREVRRQSPGFRIAALLDTLNREMPAAAFVLFGSRARGKSKKYSDYDLGLYQEKGIEFADYSRLLDFVAEWNDAQLTTAELTNLSLADDCFLDSIKSDLCFLTGSVREWISLMKRGGSKTPLYPRSEAIGTDLTCWGGGTEKR